MIVVFDTNILFFLLKRGEIILDLKEFGFLKFAVLTASIKELRKLSKKRNLLGKQAKFILENIIKNFEIIDSPSDSFDKDVRNIKEWWNKKELPIILTGDKELRKELRKNNIKTLCINKKLRVIEC